MTSDESYFYAMDSCKFAPEGQLFCIVFWELKNLKIDMKKSVVLHLSFCYFHSSGVTRLHEENVSETQIPLG